MPDEGRPKDYIPFLENGTGPPPEFAPSQVRRWSTWASVSIVACGLVLLGLTRQAVRTNVNVSKVVALSDQGYDCLGKAEVLDDKGKQWCCSKGLIPCGAASKLAEDSHSLFSEDLFPDSRDRDLSDMHKSSKDASHVLHRSDAVTAQSGSGAFVGDIAGFNRMPFDSAYSHGPLISSESALGTGPVLHADSTFSTGPVVHAASAFSAGPAVHAASAFSNGPVLHAATYSDESALSSSPLMDGDWHDVHEQTLPVHHIWTNTANDYVPGEFAHALHYPAVEPVTSIHFVGDKDCEAGLSSMDQWSHEMKVHCCAVKRIGCELMNFDCKVSDGWEHKWSSKQKSFCCETVGKGCAQSKKNFTCHTSSVNQPLIWTKERREWCCLHAKVGCPSYKMPYNCKAETQTSSAKWSESKKTWCCNHFATGCAKETSKTYDCKAGIKGASLWSSLKKAWCCHHEQVGCESSGHAMVKYDCLEGYSTWQRSWSPKKKAWCCAKAKKGCEEHFSCDRHQEPFWSPAEREYCCPAGHCRSESFDCKAGYSHWQMLWPSDKQEWCCSNYGRGCPPNDAYDCSDSSKVHGWSESKIMWCCQHRRVACGAERPFDCLAGYSKWQHGWSSKKKDWCCKKFSIGCPEAVEADTSPVDLDKSSESGADDFDCTAGYQSWKTGWSDTKKGFCCKKYKLGCPDKSSGWVQEVHSLPTAHLQHLHHVHHYHFGHWSQADWSHLGHAFWATHGSHKTLTTHKTHEAIDCVTDFNHWQESWSSKRAAYCCQKYHVACGKGDKLDLAAK
ncbi:unnamed protein product [Durusdinium trenchii]|uniref:Uncharacterized protein n=1 Tax=Durusdinium trenchii TaxID=1381693 RepID=A0ABP0H616_9DINO